MSGRHSDIVELPAEVDMPCSRTDYLQGPPSYEYSVVCLWHLLGNVKGAVFLTQVHPVPAQADLPSWPVGKLLR